MKRHRQHDMARLVGDLEPAAVRLPSSRDPRADDLAGGQDRFAPSGGEIGTVAALRNPATIARLAED